MKNVCAKFCIDRLPSTAFYSIQIDRQTNVRNYMYRCKRYQITCKISI